MDTMVYYHSNQSKHKRYVIDLCNGNSAKNFNTATANIIIEGDYIYNGCI